MRKQDTHFQELGFVKRDKDLCFQRPGKWSTWALSPCCKSNDKEELITMHLVRLRTGKRHLPGEGRAKNGEDEPVQRLLDTKKMTSLGPSPWPHTFSSASPSQKEGVLKSPVCVRIQKHRGIPWAPVWSWRCRQLPWWSCDHLSHRTAASWSPTSGGRCVHAQACVCVCEGRGPRNIYLILGWTVFQTRSNSFVELAGWFFPTARQKQGLEDDTDLHKNEVTKVSLVTVYDSSPFFTDFPKGGFCAFPLLCSGALVTKKTTSPAWQWFTLSMGSVYLVFSVLVSSLHVTAMWKEVFKPPLGCGSVLAWILT